MRPYEATEYLASLEYADRGAWERSRFMAYTIAQVNSTKRIKPTDILKFAWDRDRGEDVDEEERKQLAERAKQLEDFYNGGSSNTDNSG